MLKRISCILLCVLMLACTLVLASCNGGEDDSKAQVSVDGDTAGFLPESKHWGGETVNILTYAKDSYTFSDAEIDPEELIDEPVNDAFYERNALILEKYGIDIVGCFPESGEDYIAMLRNDMTSGLNEYDVICASIAYVAPLATEGLLYDFNDIGNGYIHTEKEWWDQTLTRDTAINGNIYFISGDAIVLDDEATWAIFFNKDLVSTYNLDDPYQIVRDGNWNFDTMHELIQKVDLMHGSTKSYDPAVGDQWGMVVQSYDFLLFMQGAGQTLVDNTGETPKFRIDDQRNIQVFTKFTNMVYDEQNVGIADRMGYWADMYVNEGKIFENGNALFMPNSISIVNGEGLRNAEIHYGLLPMPKADELQDEYTTSVNVYRYPVFAIPTSNVTKLDATCYALEAMAYYGKQLVTEEYYDRTLTYKRFQDDDSREMLDLIFRNRSYDLGTIFNFNNGGGDGSLYFYTKLIGQLSTDIVSTYEAQKDNYNAGLSEFIEQCYAE